jgi:outer membrane protein
MMRLFCLILLVVALCSGAARAEGLAVVDVERIFRESVPGKAGEAHLAQVRSILQKGLDALRDLYKGKEDTAEAKAALREGQVALERQFAADRLAVRQVLTAHLENAVRVWFAVSAKQGPAVRAVAPASVFLIHSPTLDATDDVMREMNKEKPTFHALPTVTVKANPQTEPGKEAPAAPAKPTARPRTP